MVQKQKNWGWRTHERAELLNRVFRNSKEFLALDIQLVPLLVCHRRMALQVSIHIQISQPRFSQLLAKVSNIFTLKKQNNNRRTIASRKVEKWGTAFLSRPWGHESGFFRDKKEIAILHFHNCCNSQITKDQSSFNGIPAMMWQTESHKRATLRELLAPGHFLWYKIWQKFSQVLRCTFSVQHNEVSGEMKLRMRDSEVSLYDNSMDWQRERRSLTIFFAVCSNWEGTFLGLKSSLREVKPRR